MKIRSGFVANSSSSSFICSIPKDQKKINLNIALNLESSHNSPIETKITNEEEAKAFAEYNGVSEESLKEILEELKKGNYVYSLCGSNEDDDPVSYLLYQHEGEEETLFKDKNIKKLYCVYE